MMGNKILSLVLKPYGLRPEHIENAGGTAGKTWRISTGGNKYFVRCRGARTSGRERIKFDHGLRRHLAKHGFCVVPPIEYGDGQSWVEHDGSIYEGSKHGMAREAGAAMAGVDVVNSGQIQRLKEQIIFAMEVGFSDDVLEIIEKRETHLLHFYPPFSLQMFDVKRLTSYAEMEDNARK